MRFYSCTESSKLGMMYAYNSAAAKRIAVFIAELHFDSVMNQSNCIMIMRIPKQQVSHVRANEMSTIASLQMQARA